MKNAEEKGEPFNIAKNFPILFGQACGNIKEILPAKDIVEQMMTECITTLKGGAELVAKL